MKAFLSVCLLFAAAACVLSQNDDLLNNECLVLLRNSDESSTNLRISRCLQTAVSLREKFKNKRLLVQLTTRCIGKELNFLNPDGSLNKANLISAVQFNTRLSDQRRAEVLARIQNCRDFDSCVSRECFRPGQL